MRHHAGVSDPVDDDKRARILDAALVTFSSYGVARTSMADIAERAGMSRPALYLHYSNKDDILRAMLARVLESAGNRAVAALDGPGRLAGQLDGFLQRWYGDLTEQLAGTQHGADIIEAKAGHAKPVADAANARLRRALTDRLSRQLGAPRTRADVVDLVDLLLLAPVGFKNDGPALTKLRRRLTALARLVAAAANG